jgi:hypothetical protein
VHQCLAARSAFLRKFDENIVVALEIVGAHASIVFNLRGIVQPIDAI